MTKTRMIGIAFAAAVAVVAYADSTTKPEVAVPALEEYKQPEGCVTSEFAVFWAALTQKEPALTELFGRTAKMREQVEGKVKNINDCNYTPARDNWDEERLFQRTAFNSKWNFEREGGGIREEYHGFRYAWYTELPRTRRESDPINRRILGYEVCRNKKACDGMGLFSSLPKVYKGPVLFNSQKPCSSLVRDRVMADLKRVEPGIGLALNTTTELGAEFTSGTFDGRKYEKVADKCFVQSIAEDAESPSSYRRIILTSYYLAPGDRIEGRTGPSYEHLDGMTLDYRFACSADEIASGSPECQFKETIAVRVCRSIGACEQMGITKDDPKLPTETPTEPDA